MHSVNVSSLTDDKSWRPSLGGHYPTSLLTIAAYRSPSLATRPSEHLFLHWRSYSGTYTADFPRALARRLPGLLANRCAPRCCLRPRGVSQRLSFRAFCMACACPDRIGPNPKFGCSRSYGSDSGHSPFTSLHSYISLSDFSPYGYYTSERLIRPYSGELHALAALSQLIALPGYPGLQSCLHGAALKSCTTNLLQDYWPAGLLNVYLQPLVSTLRSNSARRLPPGFSTTIPLPASPRE